MENFCDFQALIDILEHWDEFEIQSLKKMSLADKFDEHGHALVIHHGRGGGMTIEYRGQDAPWPRLCDVHFDTAKAVSGIFRVFY